MCLVSGSFASAASVTGRCERVSLFSRTNASHSEVHAGGPAGLAR